MTKVTFKTNINCAACKSTVEEALKNKNLYSSFDVDFKDPEKPATFELNDGVSIEDVQQLIKDAGYKAEVAKKASWMDRMLKNK